MQWSSQPWESGTLPFLLLLYRGQHQGWAPTEAAATEGPDSHAGCGRELCEGNHGVLVQASLELGTFRNFVPGLAQVQGEGVMGYLAAEGGEGLSCWKLH